MHESKCKDEDEDGSKASQSRGLLIASGGGDVSVTGHLLFKLYSSEINVQFLVFRIYSLRMQMFCVVKGSQQRSCALWKAVTSTLLELGWHFV